MGVRRIDREPRLSAAIEALTQSRSRSKQFPATLVERQRRDRRVNRADSTKPAAVLSTVKAISEGKGVNGAASAATGGSGGGYYGGGGGGGGGIGGGGQIQ